MSSFPNPTRRAVWLSIVLCACSHGGPPPAPRPQLPEARWFALQLAGQPAGRSHEVVAPLADGGTATHVTMEIRIGRLGASVEMATEATFDEVRGQLRAVHARTRLSRQVTTSEVQLDARGATVRDSAGGNVHTRTVALSGPLLGPETIRRVVAARLQRAGDTVDYRTWSPVLAAPQRVHCTAEAVETVAIDGAPTRLVRATVVGEGEGAPRKVWFGVDGREARSEIELPFGVMVATASRREPALATGGLPADLYAKTLIRSNVRLPRPRALDRLVVRLSFDDPSTTLPPLESADERITEREPTGAVIEIDRVRVPAQSVEKDIAGPEFLAASASIDPGDPQVQAIAREVIAGTSDPWERAQRLTRWVTSHMTPDAGIAFAPTAELVRDRHGTCVGYAALLAALLRAAIIPARVDFGLVYVGGVFAGHAWVEARIHGRWVPLDAALPGEGPADAARIALVRDAVDRGPGVLTAAFGTVIGHATIRVIGYGHAGEPPVRVEDTAPYAITGDRYVNPGLGLSITAPAGYRFSSMDAVWPDRTLVALDGPQGRITVVETTVAPGTDPAVAEAAALDLGSAAGCQRPTVAGRTVCAARRDGFAGVAFGDGPSLFVIEARGRDAGPLLDAVTSKLRFDRAVR